MNQKEKEPNATVGAFEESMLGCQTSVYVTHSVVV